MLEERSGHQDGRPELLSGRLQTCGHVHVRAQVRGVDFQSRANGAFNRPAGVETESHPHSVTRNALLNLRVVGHLAEFGAGRRLHDNAHKGLEGLVKHDSRGVHGLFWLMGLIFDLIHLAPQHWGGTRLRKPPHKQESVANVLVRSAPVLLHGCVHVMGDAVDEHHHVLLQALCAIRKITNVAESKNGLHFLSGNHRVEVIVALGKVARNDLSASLSKRDLQQLPELLQRALDEVRLVLFALVVVLCDVRERILRELLDQLCHFVQRTDNENFGVAGEEGGGDQ
mmetsp:Transcript_2445/g.5808  ORF Transcript_2445/g.5808 Transcript_2445/m.5808 type:complete len:284 (-) Transcript_2445:262-1113(-)